MFLIYGGFALAHWLFCFKYFKIARVIQYFREFKPVPPHVQRADRLTNMVFLILNFLSALAAGVIRYLWLSEFYHNGSTAKFRAYREAYTYCKLVVGLFEIISAIFLRLYKRTKKGEGEERINMP